MTEQNVERGVKQQTINCYIAICNAMNPTSTINELFDKISKIRDVIIIIIIIQHLYSTFIIKYIRSKELNKQIHAYIQTIYNKHQ